MITIVGRADTVGKPLQYGTADEFLKFFGLNRVSDLPKMSEIEELVRVSEQRDQTELILEETADGEIKLNIADGTFDPVSRSEEESDEAVASESAEPSEGTRQLVMRQPVKPAESEPGEADTNEHDSVSADLELSSEDEPH
jgi:segregation and condensation protein B